MLKKSTFESHLRLDWMVTSSEGGGGGIAKEDKLHQFAFLRGGVHEVNAAIFRQWINMLLHRAGMWYLNDLTKLK